MLNKLHSYFAYHLQALGYSFNLLCRKPLATLMMIFVIALGLALPALFWVFNDNVQRLTSSWQSSGHISLYLKPGLPASDQKEALERVKKTAGVGKAHLKSSQEGLNELIQQEGMHDIMRYLPENPLPAVIDIVPAMEIDSPAKADLLARQLQNMPHVEEAKVDMEWIGRLHALLGIVAKVAHAFLILLAVALVLIIGNTLRLSIQSRQEEIQVLKLIGATDAFITRPFLYAGIWYAFIGALVAVLLVNVFLLSLGMVVNQLVVVYQMHYPISGLSIRQILLLFFFAIILGWLGAKLSVKRQLASIEPL